jgi:hypothetical protein
MLKTTNLRRLKVAFFNSILSARLISILDFVLRFLGLSADPNLLADST